MKSPYSQITKLQKQDQFSIVVVVSPLDLEFKPPFSNSDYKHSVVITQYTRLKESNRQSVSDQSTLKHFS